MSKETDKLQEAVEMLLIASACETATVILETANKQPQTSLVLAMMMLLECHKIACPDMHKLVENLMKNDQMVEIMALYRVTMFGEEKEGGVN